MPDRQEDHRAWHPSTADGLGYLDALGHCAKDTGLLGTSAIESFANHAQGTLDHRKAGQGVGGIGQVGRLTQNPQDLGHLLRSEPDLELVHGGTLRRR